MKNSSARLEDVIAIHREIAALARAGIPLELGLRGFAGGLPTRLGYLADRIADRLNNGLSLADAVESEGRRESSVYAAVIGAGIRSGKLPEAIESLAESSEQAQRARQNAALALIHPILVCVVAYFLLSIFSATGFRRILQSAHDFQVTDDPAIRFVQWFYDNMTVLAWLIPAGIALLVIIVRWLPHSLLDWMERYGSSPMVRSLGTTFMFVFPRRRLSRMLLLSLKPAPISRWLNLAQFAEILRIQLEHGLPLAESVVRAAESTSDARLRNAARLLSEELNQGIPFSEAIANAQAIPPLMRWMMASGAHENTLVESLKLLRDSSRLRADYGIRMLKIWLPILTTVFVSGTIVLAYAFIVFRVLVAFWMGTMS